MKNLLKYLKPYKKQLILGPSAKLVEAVFELTLPILMARLIDIGIKNNDKSYIISISAVMAVISALGLICAIFCQYSASVASQGFGTAVRNEVFKKIGTLSHSQLDKFGASSLVNRASNDVTQLQTAVAMFIRLVIRAPFLSIGGVIMAMSIDFKLSILLMVFIPVFIFLLFAIMKITIPLYKSVQKSLDGLALIIRENLMGIRVIRAFAKSYDEEERFKKSNGFWTKISIKSGIFSALISPATLIIMNLASLAIVYYGGKRVNIGGLTQGQLIAFISYITQIMLALIVVSNLAVLFNKAFASASRIQEIFSTEPEIKSKENASLFDTSIPVSLEFKNVSLNYGTGESALADISFKAEKNQTIGIIGGTGSGKSSLLNMIPRFYDSSQGAIEINGIDIKDYDLNSLREHISLVPQKAELFTGTIKSNLLWGRRSASYEDMKEAAKASQAMEFIERLPEKFNTEVAQGGKSLSGGQRQRLAIARALMKKAPILLLDDSASALDYITAYKLKMALEEINEGIILISSQRVSNIMDCDTILVLDGGRLAAIGTHSELLKNSELYRKICRSQKISIDEAA
ncbi:ABC transporter ATP-binding protein [Anaeropeptidivorans aminofermentans]|uniref:ABC transporter ATP-binding protein n=1 Tax=Anaeropeptidivorans aminofermentans TaxID=2934315 RepID=UPI002023ECC8|nr:ABC transporter ATP-binding protein [Anaeropeptidivorans aminofermentans]